MDKRRAGSSNNEKKSNKQIKTLVEDGQDIFAHFKQQQEYLKEQMQCLDQAHQAIQNILTTKSSTKSIEWSEITNLIGVFTMIEELKKTWVGKVFEGKQLQEYAKRSLANLEYDSGLARLRLFFKAN